MNFELIRTKFPSDFKTEDPILIELFEKNVEINTAVFKKATSKDKELFKITKFSYIFPVEIFLFD
jgi:hypothetical protein